MARALPSIHTWSEPPGNSIAPNDAVEASCEQSNEPYCGIMAICGGLRVLGHVLNLKTLVDRKYVSHPSGSSVEDLLAAARDRGVYCAAAKNLSVQQISLLKNPTVLHVRKAATSPTCDHFILLYRSLDDHQMIFDPPNGVYAFQPPKLNDVWGGAAILLADSESELASVVDNLTHDQRLTFGSALLIFVALSILAMIAKRKPLIFQSLSRGRT
ncbi:MAG: cysteine peptidase family C39 domain-containing protein [Acidobacteriales bacterium]|nr:cysteine peptidase family C39 domain-containing protein [Terriglobales bacterium]